MSQSSFSGEITKTASEALTSAKYHIVQMDSSGDCEIGESATDLLIGVLQNEPASGESALVRFQGTSKVVSGGSVSIGDWVTSDASGHAVATTTDKNIVIGKALEAADSSDIFEIQLGIFTLSV